MPKWNTPLHYHLTYKQGLQPISRQDEMFATGKSAEDMIEEIAGRFQANGCRVKVYNGHTGIRAYDCGDETWSDRSFEVAGCTDWQCDTAAMTYGKWMESDRQKYLEVLKERVNTMIICLNPATIGGQPPLREYLALAQKYGFGGVEFGMGEVMELAKGSSLGEVKGMFDQYEVQPATFGLPVDWRKDDAAFQDGMRGLPELAQAAQAIGSRRCCTWLPPAIADDPVAFRNLARTRFREIATVLGDHNIRFGLEWVGPYTLRHGPGAMGPNEFIWNIPGMLELIADIDAPNDNVGLLADSFHWFTTGATVADIEALRPEQVVHVHINDAPDRPRDEQKDFERLLPGDGVIDLTGFLGALKKIGYAGPVAVETFNKEVSGLGYEEASRRTAEAVRNVMGGMNG